MTTTTDVLVVGAGPTGLLLAGDLAQAGLDVTLVERRPDKISNLSRALVVHARTLEQFDARGIADEVVKGGHQIPRLQIFQRARPDFSRLPTRFPYVLFHPQYEVERVLARRAGEAGVNVVHDTRVVDLEQDDSGVTVQAGTGDEAAPSRTFRASYVVGTDGVHSTVRDLAGLPFPGKTMLSSLILADVRLADPPQQPFSVNAVPDGFCLLSEMGQGWHRVTGWNRHHQLPDDSPLEDDEIQELLDMVFGSRYKIAEIRWKSRFHSDERQAPHYRVGRVFLAGDAAHVHSPAGAMGMNVGLQDAANLSWKLVAVMRHGAPGRLLDTYETERHSIGKVVLRLSGALVRAALLRNPAARAFRWTAASIVTRIRPLVDRMASMISGIGHAYPAERGAHPLTGQRAPDWEVTEGRLYEVLRERRFVLITPSRSPRHVSVPDHIVRAHWDRDTSVLVRPDGYVAWARDKRDDSGLREAIAESAGEGR
ncbi:FAD-dependent monooxygenase [Actinomadura sp. 3N407]|uniref:FAD-dependent monooxygenase n=1 Tax=Actinomadura sp. 3N407 TaxID=3457423 RepID=UPI003FCE9CD4